MYNTEYTEITQLRANILGGMNSYVKDNWYSKDNSIRDLWESVFPPNCNEEVLFLYADNEQLWLKVIDAFAECCKKMDIIPSV